MPDEKKIELAESKDVCRCRDGRVEISDLSIAAAFLALDRVAWDGDKGFTWPGGDDKAWREHVNRQGILAIETALSGSHVERLPRLLRVDWYDEENRVAYRAGEIAPKPQVVFHLTCHYRQYQRTGATVVRKWAEAESIEWYRRWFRGPGALVVSPRTYESCVNKLKDYLRQNHKLDLRRQS
jgi:hypothetical protein